MALPIELNIDKILPVIILHRQPVLQRKLVAYAIALYIKVIDYFVNELQNFD